MALFNEQPKFLNTLSEIIDNYDGFIFDVWGVLYDGQKVFPDAIKTMEILKDMGKSSVLLTNSPRRKHEIADKLAVRGIGAELYSDIVCSGEEAYKTLEDPNNEFGTKCYYMGDDEFWSLRGLETIQTVDHIDDADFALISNADIRYNDVQLLDQDLKELKARNIPLICTNPDLVVRVGDVLYTCGGEMARQYEAIGGRSYYFGKPKPLVYEVAQECVGVKDKSKILAVGDSLHTDVAGAVQFGIDVVFNLPGIHWADVAINEKTNLFDQQKALDLINSHEFKPKYYMNGLSA